MFCSSLSMFDPFSPWVIPCHGHIHPFPPQACASLPRLGLERPQSRPSVIPLPHPTNPTQTLLEQINAHKDTRTTHLYMIWVTYIHIHINIYIYLSLSISISLSLYIYINISVYNIYVYWTWQFSKCWIASTYLDSSRIDWFTYLCIKLLWINGNSTVCLWVVTIPHFKKNYYKHLEFWNCPVGGKCLPTPLIQSLC
jgi:hypothetical protein